MNNKKSKALISGGAIGSIICSIAEIFIYHNRLREVETQSFTVVGSNEVRTAMVGIENWLPLVILFAILLGVCLFMMGIGFKIKAKK